MEILKDIHDSLLGDLNPNILSSDSARSLLFLIFGFGVAVFLMRTLKRAVCWWIGLILFMEIMHFAALQTVLGVKFPILVSIFRYDVLSMLAQLCVGTKLCDILLYIRAFLEATIGTAIMYIYYFMMWFIDYLKEYTPFFRWFKNR